MNDGSYKNLRLGFACHWIPSKQKAWSGTPWALRDALYNRCELLDLGIELPRTLQHLLRIGHVRPTREGLKSRWQQSFVTDRIVEYRLRRAEEAFRPDVVLQIQDLSSLRRPYFTYQDLSFGVLLEMHKDGFPLPQFAALSQGLLQRRHERQLEIYGGSTGIFAMSNWLKESLVRDGIPETKVHVVHPGTNVMGSKDVKGSLRTGLPKPRLEPFLGSRPPRLLFVGRDFYRKGGDLVVRAFVALRNRSSPDAVLTIIGPNEWPLSGPPPPGVVFLGEQSQDQVRHHMLSSDVFVMPSRFEAFGIVFAEALAAGVPCVARNAFAMPEIVGPGSGGALVEGESVKELEGVIAEVIHNLELHERVWQRRREASNYWSWHRAGDEMLSLFAGSDGSA